MTQIITGVGASLGGVGGSMAALDRALARVIAAGCDHAELSTAALHPTADGRDNDARIAAIAKVCARHALSYSLHAPIAINLMDGTHAALHVEVLRSSIRFAAAVGASVVVVHPGRVHPQADLADRARLLAFEREQVLRAADLAGTHGIRIGLENLNPNRNMMAGTLASYALDPVALAAQISAINHPAVCGVMDFGHGWLAAGRLGFDYPAAMRAFAPSVGHLHVTENCGKPITLVDATDDEHIAYGMGDLHLPLGWGSVPYDTLLADLPIRAATKMVLEIKGAHHDELPASVSLARQFAARLNA